MSVVASKKTDWEEVLNGKARLIHQQIASLQRWVEQAGGGDALLEQLSAPYYELLQSIYKEDFLLASFDIKRPNFSRRLHSPGKVLSHLKRQGSLQERGKKRLLKAKWNPVEERLLFLKNMTTPATAMISTKDRHLLLKSLTSLPKMLSTLIVLHYLQDVPLRDVAQILSVTPSRIFQLHHQALAQLKQSWHHRQALS